MRAALPGLLISLSLLSACGEQSALEPSRPNRFAGSERIIGPDQITVMTRNLYVGADVDQVTLALISPDPNDDLPALLGAIQVVQQTDFPSRAAAIADEIAQTEPDVVGLQEVFQLDIDLTGIGIPVTVHQNFLNILMAALAQRGLNYQVAATVQNTTAAPFPGISLIDHDAVLVGPRVTVDPAVIAQNFSTNIGPVAPGISIIRGWIAIGASVNGAHYTVVNTHLESGGQPGLDLLRAAQAQELAASLGATSPAILLGDFNDKAGSPMYQVLSAAGFTDVWASMHPGAEGLTCCHVEDLSNPRAAPTQRIDYVFARGVGTPRDPTKGWIVRTGWRPGDKVAGPFYPLWPSDHIGLVANLISFDPRAVAIH